MNTLLMTGGAGFLGRALLTLCQHNSHLAVHATYARTRPAPMPPVIFHPCDLRHHAEVASLIETIRPQTIIHTACSNHSPSGEESILPAATNLSIIAAQHGIRLVHISTDMVFNGENAPYSEESPLHPITPYGQLKAEAERVIQATIPNALIIRPSLIYGFEPLDHQSRWLLQAISHHTPLTLFTDEIRCPIWVHTLAQALVELMESEHSGILHLAGPQALSRWEIGQHLVAFHHKRLPSWIQPSTVAESELTRPRDLTLHIHKARALLQTPLLSFEEVRDRLRAT